MDCDCELLHNEPPSIPLYLFLSFFFLTSPVSPTPLSHTQTHTVMHAYIQARRCSYMHRKRM